MKTSHIYSSVLLAGLLLFILVAAGCQREVNIDLDKGFSSQIQQIVPQPILDSLRKKGLIINEGLVPPQLSGIYLVDRNILQVSYGPQDTKKPGDLFLSYYYKFYGQNAAGNITYDYSTDNKSDVGNGKGAFIAGNGNKFTIFSEQISTTSGIPNKQLTVISGEVTAGGIQGWQNSFILTDKTGDNSGKLVPIGASRIFKDADGLAVKGVYYPMSVKPKPDEQQVESIQASASVPALSAAQ